MAVDSKHEHYEAFAHIWQKCEDVVKGQDSVHSRGVTYLPKLKDQSEEDYNAYKLRATFYNATGRTVDGLVGMVMRKPPMVEATDQFKLMLDDVDLKGTHLNTFVDHLMRKVITTNRVGCLVEYPQVESQPVTLAESQQANLRPYVSMYDAPAIINWRVERVNNIMQPVMIVLAETSTEYQGFDVKKKEQLRVLILDGVYRQEIYQKQEKTSKWELISSSIPLMNGRPLSFIPFWVFGDGENLTPEVPMILDLVNLNLAHYRVSADHEHGCHFAGLPTAIVAGYDNADGEKLYIGSSSAWVFPHPDAKAFYLEFTGQGLGALETNLSRKEAQMATVGARFLEGQKAAAEATETLQLRTSGETSSLAGTAQIVTKDLTAMLTFMAEWAGLAQEVEIQLNTDYFPVPMTSQQLAEIVKSWQAGAISFETLFENLKYGEVISENTTIEDEKERLANAQPVLADGA